MVIITISGSSFSWACPWWSWTNSRMPSGPMSGRSGSDSLSDGAGGEGVTVCTGVMVSRRLLSSLLASNWKRTMFKALWGRLAPCRRLLQGVLDPLGEFRGDGDREFAVRLEDFGQGRHWVLESLRAVKGDVGLWCFSNHGLG